MCSIPLAHDGEVIGVLTLERVGLAPPLQDELAQCEHLAALVAPLLALRQLLGQRDAEGIGCIRLRGGSAACVETKVGWTSPSPSAPGLG